MSRKHRHKPNKAGLPPETAIYTGQAEAQSVVNIVQYNDGFFDEKILRGPDCVLSTTDKVTWYDVRGLNETPIVEHIGQTFQMHPLAVEDILNTSQRPKWEDYPNGIFIIIRALRFNDKTDDFIKNKNIISNFWNFNKFIEFIEILDNPSILTRVLINYIKYNVVPEESSVKKK